MAQQDPLLALVAAAPSAEKSTSPRGKIPKRTFLLKYIWGAELGPEGGKKRNRCTTFSTLLKKCNSINCSCKVRTRVNLDFMPLEVKWNSEFQEKGPVELFCT